MKALSNFAYSLQARQNDRLFDEDLKQLKGTALGLLLCPVNSGRLFQMLSPEIQNNWAIKRLIKKRPSVQHRSTTWFHKPNKKKTTSQEKA